MGEFRMPSLGADMDEGTLVEWLVAPGDTVHRGDIVAVVDTAKSAIEIEIFEDGVVEELLVPIGTTVPVGEVLARLAGGDGGAAIPRTVEAEGGQGGHSVTQLTQSRGGAEPDAAREPAVASPIVRHLAHEKGVDLTTVKGTGPNGTVTRDDVQAAAAAPTAAPTPNNAVVDRPHEGGHLTRSDGGGRLRASPFARRRADELGVDLSTVTGTGPDGAITVTDVERAASAARPIPAASEPKPQPAASPTPANELVDRPQEGAELTQSSGAGSAKEKARAKQAAMRAAIGDLMAKSKREIPHYYLTQNIDLRTAMEWMQEANAARGAEQRLIPAALLLKAVATAVTKVPEVNGCYTDGAFHRGEGVHLGVAVSLRGGGLVAPAIHDADARSLDDLMVALKDLVARARAGRLRGSEMSDPTITVTNLGDQGVESVVGVIYPPQVALVGFGRIVERPWAVDGMLAVHPIVTASLAADHRVTDGHRGGLFLSAVDDLLQRPEDL
jgi:pyruvate dehydrogenase E2 component (dihydrolipoamide acetyltransferase)